MKTTDGDEGAVDDADDGDDGLAVFTNSEDLEGIGQRGLGLQPMAKRCRLGFVDDDAGHAFDRSGAGAQQRRCCRLVASVVEGDGVRLRPLIEADLPRIVEGIGDDAYLQKTGPTLQLGFRNGDIAVYVKVDDSTRSEDEIVEALENLAAVIVDRI